MADLEMLDDPLAKNCQSQLATAEMLFEHK